MVQYITFQFTSVPIKNFEFLAQNREFPANLIIFWLRRCETTQDRSLESGNSRPLAEKVLEPSEFAHSRLSLRESNVPFAERKTTMFHIFDTNIRFCSTRLWTRSL